MKPPFFCTFWFNLISGSVFEVFIADLYVICIVNTPVTLVTLNVTLFWECLYNVLDEQRCCCFNYWLWSGIYVLGNTEYTNEIPKIKLSSLLQWMLNFLYQNKKISYLQFLCSLKGWFPHGNSRRCIMCHSSWVLHKIYIQCPTSKYSPRDCWYHPQCQSTI